MNNIINGSARTLNCIHQSHVLVNVRLFLMNTTVECSAQLRRNVGHLSWPFLARRFYRRVGEPDYFPQFPGVSSGQRSRAYLKKKKHRHTWTIYALTKPASTKARVWFLGSCNRTWSQPTFSSVQLGTWRLLTLSSLNLLWRGKSPLQPLQVATRSDPDLSSLYDAAYVYLQSGNLCNL